MRLTNFKNGEKSGHNFCSDIGLWSQISFRMCPTLKVNILSLENASHWIVLMGQKQAQTVKGGLINGYGQLYHEVR